MQLLPVRLLAFAIALALPLSGCGGDDDGDGSSDGPPSDAALGADSSEILPDAGATTTCGDDPVMYCERATEICVRRDLGAGVIYECAALPGGCDATRDCASCDGVCNESDECLDGDSDNTIICSCTECV